MIMNWSNLLLLLSLNCLLLLSENQAFKSTTAFSSISAPRYHHHYINTAAIHLQQQSTLIISRSRSCTQIFYTDTNRQETMSSSSTTKVTTYTTIMSGPTLPKLASNAKRLFLVRHGEVINPGGDRRVYYGAMDIELSPLGKAEARAAADYLSQFQLNKVFSSPLKRAVYGAQEILKKQQQQSSSLLVDEDVIILDGFKELDRGAWCGLTKEEIGIDNFIRFDACDESITPMGGESYPFLKSRVLKALGTCTNNNKNDDKNSRSVLSMMQPGESAAIVSHLQVTRSILSQALNIPTSEMTSKLPIATASITCIDYTEKKTESSDDNDDSDYIMTVHYQSFKPDSGLAKAKDGAN